LVLTRDQMQNIAAPGVRVQPVYEWLLAGPANAGC